MLTIVINCLAYTPTYTVYVVKTLPPDHCLYTSAPFLRGRANTRIQWVHVESNAVATILTIYNYHFLGINYYSFSIILPLSFF